jgi:hypothetical protein
MSDYYYYHIHLILDLSETLSLPLRTRLPSYNAFMGDLYRLMKGVSALPIESPDRVEERANAFASAFSTTWETNVVEVVIKSHSKGWWSKECSDAIKCYQESHNPWHYKQFQLVVKDAK